MTSVNVSQTGQHVTKQFGVVRNKATEHFMQL